MLSLKKNRNREEVITMKRANGTGHITKLAGNRRRPYAIRKVIGWTEKGTPRYKYISYHKTRREAERALNKYNEDPYTLGKFTLEDIYKEWYAIQASTKAENTLRGYRTSWAHLEPLYNEKIQNIDRFTLQRFLDDTNLSEHALDRMKILLKAIFEYGVKKGILPTTALMLHKSVDFQPKKEAKVNPHTLFTKDEIDTLWKNKDDDIAKLLLIYIYTGMRYSELKELTPQHMHEDYFEITRAKTAAGKRQVPLSDKVKSLFPLPEVPPHTTFQSKISKIMPGHTPHDTRHTFVSLMVGAGVDDRIVKAIVGHKPVDITEHYTHITLDIMLEAVNKI